MNNNVNPTCCKLHILVSLLLQKYTSWCQYVFKRAHLGVAISLKVFILVSVCPQNCTYWCNYVFKSEHHCFTMSLKVDMLVSLCSQKYTSMCQYFFKSVHLGTSIWTFRHLEHQNRSIISIINSFGIGWVNMTHRCTVRQTFIVCHNRVKKHSS